MMSLEEQQALIESQNVKALTPEEQVALIELQRVKALKEHDPNNPFRTPPTRQLSPEEQAAIIELQKAMQSTNPIRRILPPRPLMPATNSTHRDSSTNLDLSPAHLCPRQTSHSCRK